jgi:hypothetical protein
MRVAKSVSSTPAINLTCLDPNTSQSDITQWGLAAYIINGWRRPRVDSFQTFSGNSAPTFSITTGVWDFANAQASVYETGVKGLVYQASFPTAGVTTGTAFALSIGGFAQQTGNAGAGLSPDGYLGETIMWLSALSADQLVPAHHYLRIKWGIG